MNSDELNESNARLDFEFKSSLEVKFSNQIFDEADLENTVKTRTAIVIIRCMVLIALCYLIMHINSSVRIKIPGHDQCIKDFAFEELKYFNRIANENKSFLRLSEIITSALLDLTLLSLIFITVLRTKTGSPFYIVVMFYGIRAIIQANFAMRFPVGGVWPYPGIPSLTVPYGLKRDFYYSGHCGFLALNSYLIRREGFQLLSVFMVVAIPFVAFVLLSTRIHYSIDVPIGVFFGFYSAIIIDNSAKLIDRTLRKILLILSQKFFGQI